MTVSPTRHLCFLAALAATLLAAAPGAGQQAEDWCAARDIGRAQHCEIRHLRFGMTSGELLVNVGANAGIQVEAYEGTEVRVTARVTARGRNATAARDLASRVDLRASAGEVRATGPRTTGTQSWSVSVRVLVPAGVAINASTTNGSINVAGTQAPVRARTTNGSITISDVVSRLDVATTNGTVRADLSHSAQALEGVRIRTTNGSVRLTVPANLSARLELSTTNGGINTDLPITVQGRVNRRQVSAVLGNGGPEINIGTTNGGIRITSH